MKTTFGSEPPLGGTKARVAFDIFDLPKVTSGLVRGVPEPQVST